jgi:hypothetical protein
VNGSISGCCTRRVSTAIRRSGSRYGSPRSMSVSTIVKIAVFPPMPNASVTTATAAKSGLRRKCRPA